jgi:hypothetical protein
LEGGRTSLGAARPWSIVANGPDFAYVYGKFELSDQSLHPDPTPFAAGGLGNLEAGLWQPDCHRLYPDSEGIIPCPSRVICPRRHPMAVHCDTEGAAQWGEIQHATQPTRASCNGRPLGVLAPALVARLMVVLSKKTSLSDTRSTENELACRLGKLSVFALHR